MQPSPSFCSEYFCSVFVLPGAAMREKLLLPVMRWKPAWADKLSRTSQLEASSGKSIREWAEPRSVGTTLLVRFRQEIQELSAEVGSEGCRRAAKWRMRVPTTP